MFLNSISRIRFRSVGLNCRDCGARCHTDCQPLLTEICVPSKSTKLSKGFRGYVADYAPSVAPLIPPLILECVNEIENRGLNEFGLYRVCGSVHKIKALKERFLHSKSRPDLGNIDVHVLCGCVEDFLCSLREPLIPANQWEDFCNAVQHPSADDIKQHLFKAINDMPQSNRDTLAFLVLHFHRIAGCADILMPLDNIARTFSLTIVGYSSASTSASASTSTSTSTSNQHDLFKEISAQYAVMSNLLKISVDYWSQFVYLRERKENHSPSHNDDELYSLLGKIYFSFNLRNSVFTKLLKFIFLL